MAYNPHELSVLEHTNGFTLWHYRTPDTANEVDAAGYFNRAVDMLRVGDMIMVNTGIDDTPFGGIVLVVRANITVSNLTLDAPSHVEEPVLAAMTELVPEPTELTEPELRNMMRDPRYWRDRDPVFTERVREGFARLYKGDRNI